MVKSVGRYIIWQIRRIKEILFLPAMTVQYPFVHKQIPLFSRQSLRLERKECTGCGECESKCPVDAIEMDSKPIPPNQTATRSSKGYDFEKQVVQMTVDYSQCVFCGICVETCAPEALTFMKSAPPVEEATGSLKSPLIRSQQIAPGKWV